MDNNCTNQSKKLARKGFDVINNSFFVEELASYKNFLSKTEDRISTISFSDFSSYYQYLHGNIYKNACYYKYNFPQDEIIKYSLDMSKINSDSIITYNIDNFTLEFSESEKQWYNTAEERKTILKEWIILFNKCQNHAEFKQIITNLKQSDLSNKLNFFIYNFICSSNKNAFEIITQYLNENDLLYFNKDDLFNFEKALCLIFNPNDVINAYDSSKFYSRKTAQEWKDELKFFTNRLANKEIEFSTELYFDKDLHYFVWHKVGKPKNYVSKRILVEAYRYFETLEEFAGFLDNDLSDCDLTQAILPDFNISKYKINKRTKLPIQFQDKLTYSIIKKYDRFKKCFVVKQTWTDKYGNLIKNYNHSFDYFFDFVHFLKGDLSDADLLFCDGLQNISDFKDLNLHNAILKSNILDKLGVDYEAIKKTTETFSVIESNEIETTATLTVDRVDLNGEEILNNQKIYYVSDLHLLHRISNANCKSFYDELYVLQQIIDCLLNSVRSFEKNIILIGGDTSSDFSLFKLFIKLLRASIDEKELEVNVIFTLGNHELWDFEDANFDEIVAKYRKVISDNKMYLLQNNMIIKYNRNDIEEVRTEELEHISKDNLLKRLTTARLIIFGGLGFAGYNEEFNANQLIYKSAINRQQEIEESKKFEKLYGKIRSELSDKRVIIFTHMPQKDWCSDFTPIKGFIYVSGHSHRNYFYDDGDYRIYSDNQIGYYQNNCRLKYFYIEDDYDLFEAYKNGIYEITREQYIEFYIGKNIYMDFFRKFDKLYMLKKNGYYMFILESAKGNLNIMNGGALKLLEKKPLSYYYENMDKVISYVKTPLDTFSNYQKQIADEIKSIGGSGNIHGAIIDIDFFNHIYVNPIDLTITAYWASDIINKVIFTDTPALLQSNCPELYCNYLKQIESKSETALVLTKSNTNKLPQLYLDTDIYRASREIKKMQRLNSNILSIWIELQTKELGNKNVKRRTGKR